jgi:hypothetical protein
MTEWRAVPGFDGYEVSDEGQVRSHRRSAPRIIVGGLNEKGYRLVSLFAGSKSTRRTQAVHALVLSAFVGPRPEGQQVRHLDGNPANNSLANLAYGTAAENKQDAIRHGTQGQRWTHCIRGHEFTDENTYISRKGRQQCRTCMRQRNRAWRASRQGVAA